MSKLWLPEGFHYGLHIEHRPLESAGPMLADDDPKFLWHTTESSWETVDSMYGVLRDKRAAPQLLIGGRERFRHPIVIQMIPLNQAGRSLANDASDGFQTNRDNVMQAEICWRAGLSGQLTTWHYKALANLVRLVNIAQPDKREIPPRLARRFIDTRRFGDAEFTRVSGHLGHMHAPDNDHTDPGTGFKGSVLMRLLADMPHGGYSL